MTIPANNWCSTCQESCHDHSSICTVCGTTLEAAPSTNATSSSSFTGVRAIPEFMTDEFRQAGRDLHNMLSDLRGQVRNLDATARDVLQGGEWQSIPAEMLDPQGGQSQSSNSRPTSKATLAKIPRITIETKSSLLHQITINIRSDDGESLPQLQAVLGEFGPENLSTLENATLLVASPRTGKGGLDEDIHSKIQQQAGSSVILYMERGDGVTFVKKAMLAERAGASAVIIGNNMLQPWPYVMKDSKGEAKTYNLSIPVVMVKQSDGRSILDFCCNGRQLNTRSVKSTLNIQSLTKECVVCRDSFDVGQTVVQLPACGHVFHESCALMWLTKQNTCPYCRRELPTDDQAYEEERRRTQRTHAGSDVRSNATSEWNAFYG